MTLAEYVDLQSKGARILDQGEVRRGGAGPSDARAYVIDGHPVMVPALSPSALTSNYAFVQKDGLWRLERDGRLLCHAKAVPTPRFYGLATADGIPYRKIAMLHGEDCLASTVVQECVRYNSRRTRCRFCAIGASLEHESTIHTKTPEQLAEVAQAAKQLDGVKHVTLTAGTSTPPDTGAEYLGKCAAAIREAADLPVEIQFEPLKDKGLYARLKDMGVTDVGMHVESFDPAVRRRMTPGKAEITLERYFEAFEDAVAVFGRNKVSTYVILGLGEDRKLTLEGCEKAAAIGVYPVVVPLRPLMDSCLAKAKPVDPAYLDRMYKAVGEILNKHGLCTEASSAGCVRCRACSLLQFTEAAPRPRFRSRRRELLKPAIADDQVELRVARTEAEFEEYMELRREVFVQEQGIFEGSDRDSHDDEAIPIVAMVKGRLAGVVRCYPLRDDIWYGGRLAVRKEFRTSANIGAMLVRKAVSVMEERKDVRRFFALVQFQNVRFFQRIGWVKRGKVFVMQGCRHQLMEKPLHVEQS